MRFLRPKKIYFDPYVREQEFPAGWYEVWTAKEGYEELLENAILSRSLSREMFWEKRHTLVRVYAGRFGAVIAWKTRKTKKNKISRMPGVISLAWGKLVVNVFWERAKKERA